MVMQKRITGNSNAAQLLKAIETGEIQDGKTIMLLQYAFIHLFKTKGTFTSR
jgi:hypothetical protein